MNHWPQPLRAPSRLPRLVRHEPFSFLPLALFTGMLLAPRPGRADEAPTYSVAVMHGNGARTVTHTVDEAMLPADYFIPSVTQSTAPTRWPGWLTLGAGALAVGLGAGLAYNAAQDGLTLHAQVTANPLAFASPSAQQQVADRVTALEDRAKLGVGVAAGGLVAAGIGTWLLLRQPSRHAALVPTGQGAELVVAF